MSRTAVLGATGPGPSSRPAPGRATAPGRPTRTGTPPGARASPGVRPEGPRNRALRAWGRLGRPTTTHRPRDLLHGRREPSGGNPAATQPGTGHEGRGLPRRLPSRPGRPPPAAAHPARPGQGCSRRNTLRPGPLPAGAPCTTGGRPWPGVSAAPGPAPGSCAARPWPAGRGTRPARWGHWSAGNARPGGTANAANATVNAMVKRPESLSINS